MRLDEGVAEVSEFLGGGGGEKVRADCRGTGRGLELFSILSDVVFLPRRPSEFLVVSNFCTDIY